MIAPTLCVTGTRSVLPCIPTQSVGAIKKVGDSPPHLPPQTLRDTSVLKATLPIPELDNALC
jgi:hypothetical protein